MIHVHVWHPIAKLRHSLPALSISITSFQLYVRISQQCPTYSAQAEPTAFEESTRSPFTLAQSTEPGFPFETVLACMPTELPNAKWKWHRRALPQLFQVKD